MFILEQALDSELTAECERVIAERFGLDPADFSCDELERALETEAREEAATKTDPVRSSDDPHENRIQTSTGLYYNYQTPKAEDIRLEDIAHHLAGTMRFSGATDPWISVAEHSVSVARLCPPEKKLAGFLHDAPEAYLWDVPKPAKALYEPVYSELTAECERVIAERFGLDPADFSCDEVKEADWIMLNYEGSLGLPHWSEPKPEVPHGALDWSMGLTPRAAKKLFLEEAARLGLTKVDYAPPLPC